VAALLDVAVVRWISRGLKIGGAMLTNKRLVGRQVPIGSSGFSIYPTYLVVLQARYPTNYILYMDKIANEYLF
jgi:hypothetical protein